MHRLGSHYVARLRVVVVALAAEGLITRRKRSRNV